MTLAFVLVNTALGQEKEVLGILRGIPSVRDAYEIYGVHDIILKVEAESQNAFQQVVSVIRKVDGVQSTLTMVVITE